MPRAFDPVAFFTIQHAYRHARANAGRTPLSRPDAERLGGRLLAAIVSNMANGVKDPATLAALAIAALATDSGLIQAAADLLS